MIILFRYCDHFLIEYIVYRKLLNHIEKYILNEL